MVAGDAAKRFVVPVARQIGLSIIGTLVATVLMTGVQNGSFGSRTQSDMAPELTSGGKFAARVAVVSDVPGADASPADSMPWTIGPTATAVASSANAPDVVEAIDVQPTQRATTGPGKPPHHSGRLEAKRRQVADVMPPRRADFVGSSEAATADIGSSATLQAADAGGIWPATKAIYAHALGIGGALWDRFSP